MAPLDICLGHAPGRRGLILLGGIGLGAVLGGAGSAGAAQFTVANTSDSGGGSLRDAVTQSNAQAGPDSITFASGLSGQIKLASALPNITDALDIQGPGATQLQVSGSYSYPVFTTMTGTNGQPVTISGLTVSDGSRNLGGNIGNSNAALTIANCVVKSGRAITGAGVATLTGATTIRGSTIANNYAVGSPGYGGDVVSLGGPLTIQGSTLSGGYATYGGALAIAGTTNAVIENTTIAANRAGAHGGGAFVAQSSGGSALFRADTISKNAASVSGAGAARGGGITVAGSSPPPTLANTILSGNVAKTSSADLEGAANGAFTLLGDTTGAGLTETVPGSNILGQNPQLGQLADNGGPTQTLLPAVTSPVIDKGSGGGLASDQRGALRPIDFPAFPNSTATGADGADIGAVEVQAAGGPFKFGKLKRNKKKGTAKQAVTLPKPDVGTVKIFGKGIASKTLKAPGSGKLKLPVKLKGKLAKKLKRRGKVKLTEKVTYSPTGGTPVTLKKKIKLLRKG